MSGVFGGAAAKDWQLEATVYDFAVDGALASVETPAFQDGYEYRLDVEGVSNSTGAGVSLQAALYKETDAAYSADGIVAAVTNAAVPDVFDGRLYLPDVRESLSLHVGQGVLVNRSTGARGVMHGALAMTAQKVSKARLSWSNGSNLDAGTIRLYRRAL